jgi:YD repeat-containing protein
MTLPGGTTKDFSYDPLMRIKQITSKDQGANELLNYQYNYDKMDNITVKATEYGAYAYGYDDLYRLTDVDNPVQEDEGFTYDLVGNRLTAADTTGDCIKGSAVDSCYRTKSQRQTPFTINLKHYTQRPNWNYSITPMQNVN